MKRQSVFFTMLMAALIAVTAAVGMLAFSGCDANALSLAGTVWVPLRAADASGDEVTLGDVYSTHYSNYQGTLSFEENKTFELWLSPGDPTDGTHTGMYEQKDGKINVLFDNDTEDQFEIKKEGDTTLIAVPYGEYKVYFIKQ